MDQSDELLPADFASMKALYLKERSARLDAEAKKSSNEALIAHQKLTIEKLKRELFGQRSERTVRLLDQMELQLEELEATASEDDLAAEEAARQAQLQRTPVRRKAKRRDFPEHLPRERVVVPTPACCDSCGSSRLTKLGEDIAETLEVIPRQWKVVQTVREKMSCRDCEKVSQAPAPFHVIPRGMVGPQLLSMILFEKYGQHQPLNRQSERFAREGVELSLSTMADHVGAATHVLMPLFYLIRAHVMAAERLHGDDTTVPVLAKGKTDTGRVWVYVRDDRSFAGPAPPAALFYYSRNREAEHPERHLKGYSGVFQADAFSGYGHLYDENRKDGALTEAACFAHARRKFFRLADIRARKNAKGASKVISPLAFEAVQKLDAIFKIEREINAATRDEREAYRNEHSRPLMEDLEKWMRKARKDLSKHNEVAKAMDYMLVRWSSFARFLDDGRICMTNNTAERALRGIALGRKSWMFAGSDRGGDRAAVMYTLIVTAKMNYIDPQAWLADVLARINDMPQNQLHELLPWNWAKDSGMLAA